MATIDKSTGRGAVDTRDTRVRMTLDLSNRLNAEVERIAEEDGVSKADVLRFAIELLSNAKNAKEAGLHVGAWGDTEGKRVEREFVGV